MVWVGAFAIGILISIADIFLLQNNKRAKTCITVILKDTLMVILTSLFVLKYIFNFENIFDIASRRISYSWKFLALVLGVGVAYWLLCAFITRVLKIEKCEKPQKKGATVVKVISTFFFALGVAAFTGTIWGKEAFGDLSPDQILINLNSPTEGTDPGVYISLFEGPVLVTVFLTLLFCIVVFSRFKLTYEKTANKTIISDLAKRIVCLILALVILVGGCAYGINQFQLMTLYDAYLSASTYIEDNFADPDTTPMTFPEQKRNLIHIYLESMENTFFSKEFGGYFEENLMPDLAQLTQEGYNFSHLDKGFGGPPRSTGGNWSVASFVNQGTGLPMKVPTERNSYGSENNFLPGATALGDILKEQGYAQSVMFGADGTFGGLKFYFESHGDFKVLDINGVKAEGWLPDYYNVWWGYEDDKLYEFAKTEITRLYETGKPFHFVMETADTHAPEGYLSENAEKKFDSQYANCIYYSQAEAVKFVRWIQSQPFYENTTIVLIGDHLSMSKSFCGPINDAGYYRTCYNLILNPAENIGEIPASRLQNRDWALFDMFPTLLASIGVEIEGNRLGIGTNLFSSEKTLFERDGVRFVNNELGYLSKFYNENILVDWETVDKTDEE